MDRIGKLIASLLGRRRKSWRYVSPRRKGLGALLLVLLVVVSLVYLHLTDEQRVRDQAQRILSDLTGGYVTIAHAQFKSFGSITLSGVRIDKQIGGARRPFLQAQTLILRHRPWALLLSGRLVPVEVVCTGPKLTLPEDPGQLRRLFSRRVLGGKRWLWPGELPPVRITEGKLELFSSDTGLTILVARDVRVSMVPVGSDSYSVAFEGKQQVPAAVASARFTIDLKNWKISSLEGSLPIHGLDRALPGEYRKWRRRYNVTGTLRPRSAQAKAPGGPSVAFDLVDAAMILPPEEGGLKLQGMSGTLVFDQSGLQVEHITGVIPDAGGAVLRMSGRYEGYDSSSPFDLDISLESFQLPVRRAQGGLGELLARVQQRFSPDGKFDLTVNVRRDRRGRVTYKGQVELKGVAAVYKSFPYELTDLQGVIEFDSSQARLKGIVGRHRATRVQIDGFLTGMGGGDVYDVKLSVMDGSELVLDEELRGALPGRYRRIWDEIAPRGSAVATARIFKDDPQRRYSVQVTMDLSGKASLAYRRFPYRLDNLFGRLKIDDDDVTIESLRGSRGQMGCKAQGVLLDIGTPSPQVDLTVRAWDVPVDSALLGALRAVSSTAAGTLKPAGTVKDLQAQIHRGPAQRELDYAIDVAVENAEFRVEKFPYLVQRAFGSVRIEPQKMTIHRLEGVHGRTPITVSGVVQLGSGWPGYDLRITAQELTLDDELFEALPDKLRRICTTTLGLAGRADVELLVHLLGASADATGEGEPKLDYLLSADADGLELCYKGFPYRLKDIKGRIVASPGSVVLENLTGRNGRATVTISGRLRHSSDDRRMELSISAQQVPIDDQLLGALPKQLRPLVRRIRPGGTCGIQLRKLTYACSKTPVGPASGPGSAATQPASGNCWKLDGEIRFRDAMIDLGFGRKKLTGHIEGVASLAGGDLSVRAGLGLDSIEIGKQVINNFEATIAKAPTSRRILISDITARTYGGRLAGYAEILLTDPLEYGVSLDVEDIGVQYLLSGGSTGPGRTAVTGLLDGTLNLTTTAGKPERRRGSGLLRITKASISRLPVVLGLMHVISIALPADSALAEAYVSYRVKGDTLVFEEIHLKGPGLSMVGSGTADLKTDRLSLNFFAAADPSGQLPRIAELDELLGGISRELMEVKVTGTFSHPQYSTVPLRSLEAAVRKLLSPGEQGD